MPPSPPPSPARLRAPRVGAAIAAALAVCGGLVAGAAWAQDLEYARQDPAKIVTAEACGECHLAELEVWKKTAHATGFKTLHRSDAAEAIAQKMGFRLIKRESLCLRCHYTPKVEDGELRAVSGVSCESCHGAGRDWIDVHNDYGAGATYKTEPEAHRKQRIERSRQAGMRRPSDLYPVVANCYGCHVVAEEKLVNVGGHTSGTDFELVARAGEIRHNFLAAQRGGSKDNAEDSPARKRLLYVTGRALDLEYGLRALATASENGVYAKAMIRRVRNAVFAVQDVLDRAPLPELEAMIAAVRAAKVTVGEREGLLRTADLVSRSARSFLDGHDGSSLASLDPLVNGSAKLSERAPVGAGAPAGPAPDAPPTSQPSRSDSEPSGSSTPAATVPAASTAAATRSTSVPTYAKKTHLRPHSSHATLDALSCSKCHQEQNAWWNRDPHEASAEPFAEGDPKNVQIARLYGLKPADSLRGDQLCMDCHGTVATGQERREVYDGVSCQSCHGPAADYLEPHKEGDESLGTRRPGYVKALGLGMRELRKLEVRAANCASCHYVTDPGLLATGHPSGADFDLAARMPKIKHWSEPPAAAAALRSAWQAVVTTRGPVPTVAVASLPAGGSDGGGGNVGSGASAAGGSGGVGVRDGSGGGSGDDAAARRQVRLARAGRIPRPVDPEWIPEPGEVRDLELPPFPEIDPASPVEDRLLLLKERLELLYREVGGIAGEGGKEGGE